MTNKTINDLDVITGSEVDTSNDSLPLYDLSQGRTRGIKAGELVIGSSSFLQSGTGAVARTVQGKLREDRSILDFISESLHAGILAGTNTTDLSSNFATAIAALPSSGGRIFCPGIGPYIADNITMPDYPKEVHLIGEGRGYTILQPASANTPCIKGVVNLVAGHGTGRNFIYGFTFKAHASGSTGAALDLRKFSFSKIQNIGFEVNGAGQWTYGFLLDATDHCYSNEIDDVSIKNANPISGAVCRLQNHPNLQFLTHFRISACNVPMVFSFDDAGTAMHHIIIKDGHFEGLTGITNGVIDPGNGHGNIVIQHCYFEDVIESIDRTATSVVSLMDNFFAATPGVSIAGAWPANFASIGNNISGGTNARNTILGRLVLRGANSEHGGMSLVDSTGGNSVLIQFDGTDVTANWPLKLSGVPALKLVGALRPSAPDNTAQNVCQLWANSGVPNNSNGSNGDFYFRSDGTQVANTLVYHKESGSWVSSNIMSSTYTPTLSSIANLDGATTFLAQYMRIQNVVTVSGKVQIDPTAPAAATRLGFTLPVASAFTTEEDCGGNAFASGIAGQGAAIRAEATNDQAEMVFISGDLTVQPMFYNYTYRIK